ncbi:SWIM zinc finger family protein [Parabacteroides sp. OttesenSCG-928-G06]|nr:SWIM zinc finger family protein [Parabacteroides sp. OttesenSCG-928-K15]MDL2282458.1 SWIM zinc finger family protein [Parabacteroides sp. OttesenSCG-928-G06]
MALTLNLFEFEINATILARGLRYYKNGHVADITELRGGHYEVIVEGTDTYTVNLEIKGDQVVDYRCDCPYDGGPVCKHIVAALFALQEEDREEDIPIPPKQKATKKKASTPKKKTVAEQIDELFEQLPPEELQTYVRGLLEKDRVLRNSFLTKYAYLVAPVSKELYVKRVRASVDAASGKYGYIDYSASQKLGADISEMVAEAEEAIEKENFKGAMYMAGTILEEMSEAMRMLDDSGDYVGDAIDGAIEVLVYLADSLLDEPIRQELFAYLLELYKKDILKGWSYHSDFIHLAISLIKTPKEKETIRALLDAAISSAKKTDREFENIQELKLFFVETTGTEEDKQAFMEQNLSHPDIRAEIVEKAIEKGEYEKAIRLTRYFVLNGTIRWHDQSNWQNYYLSLKEYIAPEEWPVYLEGLIQEIHTKNRWIDYERIFHVVL